MMLLPFNQSGEMLALRRACSGPHLLSRLPGGPPKGRQAASTSQMGRFETEMFSSRENVTALMDPSGTWTGLFQKRVEAPAIQEATKAFAQ